MSLPCYYWVDSTLPEDDQKISAVCLDCAKEKNIKGWYWPGDVRGYGEPLVTCHICKKEIHNEVE